MKINRHFLHGLLLMFICNNSFSQNVAVSATKMNVLYADVDNPFSFAVNNKDCNDYQLSSNNGIIKCDSSCHCTINPIEIKPTIIYIKDKDGKLVDSSEYRTKGLPIPYLVRCEEDHLDLLLIIDYLHGFPTIVSSSEFNSAFPFYIKDFEISKHRNDSLIQEMKNIGTTYSVNIKKLIDLGLPGDIFYFNNVTVITPNGKQKIISGTYRIY